MSHETVDSFVELQTRSESAQASEMGLGNFTSVPAAQRIRPARYRLNGATRGERIFRRAQFERANSGPWQITRRQSRGWMSRGYRFVRGER